MEKNNIIANWIGQLILWAIRYVFAFFPTFLICEVLAMILLLTTGSGFDEVVFLLIKYTPFQKSFGEESFTLGTKDIVLIFSFWSFFILVISSIIDKLFHPHLKVNTNLLIILFLTILHFAVFMKLSSSPGIFWAIVFFYIFSLVAWFFTNKVNKTITFINSQFKKH